jgi:hypothetical protein
VLADHPMLNRQIPQGRKPRLGTRLTGMTRNDVTGRRDRARSEMTCCHS